MKKTLRIATLAAALLVQGCAPNPKDVESMEAFAYKTCQPFSIWGYVGVTKDEQNNSIIQFRITPAPVSNEMHQQIINLVFGRTAEKTIIVEEILPKPFLKDFGICIENTWKQLDTEWQCLQSGNCIPEDINIFWAGAPIDKERLLKFLFSNRAEVKRFLSIWSVVQPFIESGKIAPFENLEEEDREKEERKPQNKGKMRKDLFEKESSPLYT